MGFLYDGHIHVIGVTELTVQEVNYLQIFGYEVDFKGNGFSIEQDNYGQTKIDDWDENFKENIDDYDDDEIEEHNQMMSYFKETNVDFGMECLNYVLIGVARRTGTIIEVEGEDVTEEEGREYFNYAITPEGEYINKIKE